VVDPTDGSVWLSPGYDPYTFKYSADGTLLYTLTSTHYHWCPAISFNPAEQTIWMTDGGPRQVIKLKSDGSEILRLSGFNVPGYSHISVDQTDGSIWVADEDPHNEVVKLDTNGNELIRVNVGSLPYFVVANPVDGGVWVAFGSEGPVKRLDSSGNVIATSEVMFPGYWVRGLDIAPDGTVWVAEMFAHKLHKLSPAGALLLTIGGDPATFWRPGSVSVFPKLVQPTIPQVVQNLVERVESMNLQQGIENSLDAKLQNVQDAIEAFNADNRNDAINKLNAFINAVEAQRGNQILNEQADYLITEAQKLIDHMS
jgi:hypothetical protein